MCVKAAVCINGHSRSKFLTLHCYLSPSLLLLWTRGLHLGGGASREEAEVSARAGLLLLPLAELRKAGVRGLLESPARVAAGPMIPFFWIVTFQHVLSRRHGMAACWHDLTAFTVQTRCATQCKTFNEKEKCYCVGLLWVTLITREPTEWSLSGWRSLMPDYGNVWRSLFFFNESLHTSMKHRLLLT